jgi:hypothetical protein
MKKIYKTLMLITSLVITTTTNAQTIVTFDTFTLSPNSYYQDISGADFSSNGVSFQYGWNTGWSGWEFGSAYTNVNDTINGTYTNLYGNITGSAFDGNNYATVQNGAFITLSNTTTAISGFYITNTTYAWKSIKKGDSFARKFGDTTGTGSGNSIAQGEYPDWFKVLVRGYRNGSMLTDSVEFYLADYRSAGTANDYAVKNWQYVNCISLGQVDSISFDMKSSDNSFGYMNTPGFFSIDNFTTQSTVGINEINSVSNFKLFPNPANEVLILNYESLITDILNISIIDINGKEIKNTNSEIFIGNNQLHIDIETLNSGIYFIDIKIKDTTKKLKFIKL